MWPRIELTLLTGKRVVCVVSVAVGQVDEIPPVPRHGASGSSPALESRSDLKQGSG